MKKTFKILFFASILLGSFVSCNKAKDPEADNTSQFVGSYTEDVTGTSLVTMSIKRVDNNRFTISYESTLLNIEFNCIVTYSNDILEKGALFFNIPEQQVTTKNTNTTLTIKGKSISSNPLIADQNGYLWKNDKTRLTFDVDVTGAITQNIKFTGIKDTPAK